MLSSAYTMAASLPAFILGPVMGQSAQMGQTLQCSEYAGANSDSATCDDEPNLVCTQKCTGGVIVGGCTLGSTTAPVSQQRCTISFGQTSAVNSICINERGSFLCSGIPVGQAICSGCVTSPPRNDVIPTGPPVGPIGTTQATPPALNTTTNASSSPPVAAAPRVPKPAVTSPAPPAAPAVAATSDANPHKVAAPVAVFSAPSDSPGSVKSTASENGSDSAIADKSTTEGKSSIAPSEYIGTFAKSIVTVAMIVAATASL